MPRSPLRHRLRNADAPALLESFFVAAVVSFLGIRAFLAATGYPRVGGGGLHVAHMLWGGLLMLAALGMLLAWLDRPVQHGAAVVAGLGFGTFIDEIGKFLTADNNYFYRPAVAIIYVLFVVLFLVSRAIVGQRQLTPRESLANALDLLEGHLEQPIEPSDRARLRALLRRAPAGSALARDVRRYVDALPAAAEHDAWYEALPARLVAAYRRLAAGTWFDRVLVTAVVVYTIAAVAGVLTLALTIGGTNQAWTVSRAGEALSTLAGAALVTRGVVALPGSRASAYRWFLRGLLTWILVTQVFVFYGSQLAGLGGLAVDLVAYVSLRFALAGEHEALRDAEEIDEAAPGTAPGAAPGAAPQPPPEAAPGAAPEAPSEAAPGAAHEAAPHGGGSWARR